MSMFRKDLLSGKRILITGGGTGLGKEFADEYMSLGAEVHICGRRGSVLDEAAAELIEKNSGTIRTHVCDVRDAAAVEAMIDGIWKESGPLTGLVNNAAGNIISPTESLSPRAFDAVSSIVMNGSFYATHACGKRWIDQGLKGSVLSTLVTWVWDGSPYTVPSAMAKSAVHIMTKSLAAEWGKFGIRLNAVAPGPFPTPGAWKRLRPGTATDGSDDDVRNIPMRRVGKMPELRALMAFLMADECEYLTGECIAIDGGAMLATAGNYSHLFSRTREEWDEVRAMSKKASDQEKAERSN